MRKINNPKVILIIVEGIHDKTSLSIHLERLNNKKNEIIFEIIHGDITTQEDTETHSITDTIYQKIISSPKHKFHITDFKEIIHIVDTDGIYIQDSDIIESTTYGRIRYSNQHIYTSNKERIIFRNKRKRNVLNTLQNTNFINKVIPYRIFYFSSNLEHVLHNKINLENNTKKRLASDFEMMFYHDPDEFYTFMCESDFSVNLNYKDSWNFIKYNNRSLQRFTNFDIFIKELKNDG